MDERARIFVAGHRGLVGSALVRALRARGLDRLLLRGREALDLRDERAVDDFFRAERPTHVFAAAARVGGILAHRDRPAEFLLDNLRIQNNLIRSAHDAGARKLVLFASSAFYPPGAGQPLREEALLSGPLDPSHEGYAVAKIAGVKLCEAYRAQFGFDAVTLVPTNLYGPGDNFDLRTAHVLPALIRRFHEAVTTGAPTVAVWGSGRARREFLHVDDLAEAAVFVMAGDAGGGMLNVGTGRDLTVAELARLVARATGFEGDIVFDASKPDGVPRKLLDVSRLTALGWRPRRSLEQGIRETLAWFRSEWRDDGGRAG